jgi:bifunctional DNA-binding transcriptional regulator/antitoxin component of YhaV-PrlF toxin-antitoxin module
MDLVIVSPPTYQVVMPKQVREQFGLSPCQQLQVIAPPGWIELVTSQSPVALRGFLHGEKPFAREADRL